MYKSYFNRSILKSNTYNKITFKKFSLFYKLHYPLTNNIICNKAIVKTRLFYRGINHYIYILNIIHTKNYTINQIILGTNSTLSNTLNNTTYTNHNNKNMRIKPNQNESELMLSKSSTNACIPISLDEIPRSILYVDSNFCVIDKPPDVRMNGKFIVNVEQLLLAWLPGITTKSLKWVHQLDYATSGKRIVVTK